MIELESRIEVAEGERDAAREQMQTMTPRPDLPPGMALPMQLGPQGTGRFAAALTKHRWRSVMTRDVPPGLRCLLHSVQVKSAQAALIRQQGFEQTSHVQCALSNCAVWVWVMSHTGGEEWPWSLTH